MKMGWEEKINVKTPPCPLAEFMTNNCYRLVALGSDRNIFILNEATIPQNGKFLKTRQLVRLHKISQFGKLSKKLFSKNRK